MIQAKEKLEAAEVQRRVVDLVHSFNGEYVHLGDIVLALLDCAYAIVELAGGDRKTRNSCLWAYAASVADKPGLVGRLVERPTVEA